MFLNNVDDNVVIKFDDPESSPQRLDQRRPSKKTSVIKIDNLHSMSTQFAKNENYIRNLGQNQARYEAEQEFNYDKMQVEKQTKPQIDAQPIQEQNPGSIINFDDYIESQSQVRSINQIDDEASQSGSNYENEKINQSQSPKKIDLSKSSMSLADVSQVVSSYPQINKDIQFFQSQDFLLSPLSQAGMVQCKFMIDESGFNKFSVKFYLIKDGIIYLAAKKTSHKYIISTEKGKYDKKASSFIGQVSCKQKNQYFMWNSGNNPKKSTKNIRESLGTLNFILDKKPNQPRQQKFQFPRQDSEYMNRLPRWNDKTKSFTLNFYDRVKKASIKNFQMIKQDAQPEKIYVQFGKVSDHEFNLDFHTPFSPLQAFMIALANYDKKIEY